VPFFLGMLDLLHSLFTLSGAAIALVVLLIVAIVIWRYRKLD
jgi:heme/copper-type cytochrome/quinol oxidase subunit 2